MSMSIRTNVASLNAQKNLTMNEAGLDASLQKLSSGYRITKAADDAAGLGISSSLTAQIKSYNQAVRNADNGISVVQTTEAALNEVNNVLTRLRELAMQSASAGIGDTERSYIQNEVNALTTEIERIADSTEFNGQALLNTSSTTLTFQVGIRNISANDRISVSTVDVQANSLSISGLSLSSQASAQSALNVLDSAISTIASTRATLGAAANRLTSVKNTIATAVESTTAANSRIRDVNVAEESSNLSRSQILMQAGVSVLAQANQMPQLALKLLG